MTVTSFVVIQSKYRTSDSRSTSDFTYSIGQALEATAVAIKSVSIPNVQYNINPSNNRLRVFYGTGGSNDATVSLPAGQYNITTFTSGLEAILRPAISDPSLTITRDPVSGKMSFTTSTVPIKISTDQIRSPLSKIIGAGDGFALTSYPVSVELSFTCPYMSDLGGLKNFYLSSRVLSQGFNGILKSGEQVPLVVDIPVTVPYGFIEQYDPQDIRLNIKQFNRAQNIQWIDIKLTDEDLNVVDLNGLDVEIVLKIYTKNDLLSEK